MVASATNKEAYTVTARHEKRPGWIIVFSAPTSKEVSKQLESYLRESPQNADGLIFGNRREGRDEIVFWHHTAFTDFTDGWYLEDSQGGFGGEHFGTSLEWDEAVEILVYEAAKYIVLSFSA